jgi:flagellar biosynthetic protein FlhB
MSEDSDDDKPHDPSQKRLDEARKRGEIPKSVDLTTAASFAGLLLSMSVFGVKILEDTGNLGRGMLGQADRLAPQILAAARAPTGGLLVGFSLAITPVFLLPFAAALISIIGQRAFVFAPEKLSLKWSRLSILATARQKFGRDGLFEFAKSFVKLTVYVAVLGAHLVHRAPEILQSLALTPAMATGVMLRLLIEFVGLVVLITGVIGAGDYLFQRFQHFERNRMSRKDLMDEMKESEGDPHVKMQRRQKGQEIATNQMLADVAKADVVLVNPTHYAVALKWNRAGRTAPICVAKGVDEIAAKIREKAAESGVPIHRDPPTARALYATVDIGDPIKAEHYRAVAAAIRFAEAMRKRKKALHK